MELYSVGILAEQLKTDQRIVRGIVVGLGLGQVISKTLVLTAEDAAKATEAYHRAQNSGKLSKWSDTRKKRK